MAATPQNPPPEGRNLKLVIAYDGTAYHGWQRQASGIDTVQQRIEQTATAVVRHPVTVHGAGRTDAGVHAEGQVANFYTTRDNIPLPGLRRAINSRLPDDIGIRSINEVPPGFHASRSAVGKTYRYRIYVAPTPPTDVGRFVYHYWKPLDVAAMRAGARWLLGRHDFASFASAGDERDNTVRTVFRCDVTEADREVRVFVQGDGFLYKMVRNIVGTLVEVGRGHWPADQVGQILAAADRQAAGPAAVAEGLAMLCVHYRREDLDGGKAK